MTTSVRASVLALAVAVMAGVLVGTVTGSDQAGAATQRTLRIPAAAFTPAVPGGDSINDGSAIWNFELGAAIFVAPVVLEGNSATIHSVQVHYFDNGPDRICIDLVRPNVRSGGKKTMSTMCTRLAVHDVRTRIDTTIKPDTVGPDNAAYLYVNLPGGQYGLYGVTIVYTSDL